MTVDEERFDYDLAVIGTGPGGQRAAIAAAKAGHRVAIIERKSVVGGVCINTGTIPSKSLREAVLYLSGWREHTFYGSSYAVKRDITIGDLLIRANFVIQHELDVIQHQMYRNGVDVLRATAAFSDPHTLVLTLLDGSGSRSIRARFIIIATGTDAAVPRDYTVDDCSIFTSDAILALDRIPHTLAVIGAGVIGCEYASMFAALGTRVTLIDARPTLLSFIDEEVAASLAFHLRENNVTLRLSETVSHVERTPEGHVSTHLKSGKHFGTEKALYSVGRVGATADLNLPSAGIAPDERGRLVVNEHYQTAVPHIYAVGDVIGFPSLASTSMEQGRLAASHAFGLPASSVPAHFPYGIYTIPEISMVGYTEADLTREGVPYEVGKASYKEIARGQIIGDQVGMLKLLFHSDSGQLLGVHIIGEGASELVHIGQAVIAFGGTVDYFVNTVFNYPTLAECYKVAAFDALNRMRG
ncbi:MAG TPA: Si-specific NAD(P)(+) transhydrogenase [Chloroflexota bacterium]|nr:Si-specific NAD(P)(+) transhydrogenase [Chloroflexota bacterium]